MFLNLLFPPHCMYCGRSLGGGRKDVGFCSECLDGLGLLGRGTCGRCGAPTPLVGSPDEPCLHCRGRKLAFDRAVALGKYDGTLRELVLQTKHWEGDATTQALARLLFGALHPRISTGEIDVVAPIPMHWSRRLRRRTNGPEIAAQWIARRSRVPVATGLLERCRPTPPQTTLPPGRRIDNVRHAFRLGEGYDLDAARVLLIDDVMTTGSTCSEAARTLKAAGALSVSVAVFARALAGDG